MENKIQHQPPRAIAAFQRTNHRLHKRLIILVGKVFFLKYYSMVKTRKSPASRKKRNRTYRKKDYDSNDGMLTTVWGPPLWHVLHAISFNYPISPTCDDKKNYRNFVCSLRFVLPCGYCRRNFRKNMKQNPLKPKNLLNRDAFSRWMYRFHEHVNAMLGKSSGLSYKDVRERYEHFRSRCTIDKRKKKQTRKKRKKEKGCTEPLYGKKSKCVVKIVPKDDRVKSFQMDKVCIKHK